MRTDSRRGGTLEALTGSKLGKKLAMGQWQSHRCSCDTNKPKPNKEQVLQVRGHAWPATTPTGAGMRTVQQTGLTVDMHDQRPTHAGLRTVKQGALADMHC